MKKLLICALALGGFAVSAQAADLSVDSLKDPLPEKLSYAGVTIYGTIDVGGAYMTEGAPTSGAMYAPVPFVLQKFSRQATGALVDNALEQSKIGVKIEENIGMGFVAIGKLETGFNPASGEISDACASLVRNNGTATTAMSMNADGSRCGQAFNGAAYGGVSSSTYGTLTLGRQNSLMNDAVATYDPMAGSYAFSLIGFSGGAAAGIGSTETARWDNSVKYAYQYGPAHAAVMYTGGNPDTSIFGDAVGANVGATYKGVSIDGFYTKENGSVNAASVSTAGASYLKATVTDNESYAVMAKYTMDLGGGSFKDEEPSAKLTFFGGYVHMDLTNYTGTTYTTGLNGYSLAGGVTLPFAAGATKTLETEFGGLKYATGAWAFTGAYYHESQSQYVDASGTCVANTATNVTKKAAGTAWGNTTAGNCSGDINVGSFLVDYTFNKHFDVYSGVTFSESAGGLNSGYLHDSNTTVASGIRLKF
jgi:predicted porin